MLGVIKKLDPYLRLMRVNQPVGIWLLFWPCAWSLLLASGGVIDISKLVLFFLGAFFMRSAGCIINDIADRNIDKHVERTKTRPLASGELNVNQAVLLLLLLLFASFIVASFLRIAVVMWGGLALVPVAVYPFMKRISWWPQLFLGLVFNWGAFMGWVALRDNIEIPAILLYIGGVLLTLGYDTIYAHQDKADDRRIGVRSSALRLGANTKKFVSFTYFLAVLCFILAVAVFSSDGGGFYINPFMILSFIPAAAHFFWQLYILDIDNPKSARMVFLSNSNSGAIIFLGIFFSMLVA